MFRKTNKQTNNQTMYNGDIMVQIRWMAQRGYSASKSEA